MNALFFVSLAVALLTLVGFVIVADFVIEKIKGYAQWFTIRDDDEALERWRLRRYGAMVKPDGPYCSVTPSGNYRVTTRRKPTVIHTVTSIKRQGARR